MNISYNWLKQFLDLSLPSNKISETLTDLGLEVEGVTSYESVKGGLEGVVVGYVKACYKHPKADRLNITKVDVGDNNLLQIVCGAPNISKGQRVAVATIGTTLYDEDGKGFVIRKSKIRGELSQGMICSENELGLGKSHEGIMVLPSSSIIGAKCSDIFEIYNDIVFEIGLTPNRSDALGHYGVARDLRAGLLQKGLLQTSIKILEVPDLTVKHISDSVSAEVLRSDLAPRYCGLTLKNIEIKESPDWLKHRLLAIGINPKNNVVDITNYVMHELGQPLHAFDYKSLKDNKIIVKTTPSGTKFTTLDGVERTLHEDDLMICDVEKPLCIAGVFGGLNSGITDETTSIFLESAYFDPISVRKTAKRHGLSTDASFRFERGIDPESVTLALKRAANLIIELSGAEIASEILDFYPNQIPPHRVSFSLNHINKLVGIKIGKATIKSILQALEILIISENKEILELEIPAYRVDVQREEDVIEEILRVYGYNNVEIPSSTSIFTTMEDNLSKPYLLERTVSEYLIHIGFFEIMTNSLTNPDYLRLTPSINPNCSVSILNSLSLDLSVMRQSMLYSMLEVMMYNHNRKQDNIRLFEFGKTYHKIANEKYEEKKHLSILTIGGESESSWKASSASMDFFYLKRIIINVLEQLKYSNVTVTSISDDIFTQGMTYYYKKNIPLVSFGIVQPNILERFDINQEILYADFDWDNMMKHFSPPNIKLNQLPKFPEVRRDLALLIDSHIEFSQIEDIVHSSKCKILKSIGLFDVYKGKNIPQGKKSYGVKFIFQDSKKTLTDKEVDKIIAKFIFQFEKLLGASLR